MLEVEDINDIIYCQLDAFDLVALSRTARRLYRQLAGRLEAIGKTVIVCDGAQIDSCYQINTRTYIVDNICRTIPISILIKSGGLTNQMFPIYLSCEISSINAITLIIETQYCKVYVYGSCKSACWARVDTFGLTMWRSPGPHPLDIYDRLHNAIRIANDKWVPYICEDYELRNKLICQFPNEPIIKSIGSRRVLEFIINQ